MSDRKCPNCGTVGIPGKDDSYACPSCGGTFTFEAGEAKLQTVGELDELRDKVKAHDADIAEFRKVLPASSPAADPEEPTDPDDESDEEDDDEEDL
jgi:uncharacterized Zn finger protein (UPF0148 family)